jgi:hypothetical protein
LHCKYLGKFHKIQKSFEIKIKGKTETKKKNREEKKRKKEKGPQHWA